MPYYRFYCLDGANKIETGYWIEAQSDEDAIMIAHANNKGIKGELWQGERLIAKIPAYWESQQSSLRPLAMSLGLSSGKRRSLR